MEKVVGTVVRGLRAPIFKSGDDLVQMIPDLLDRFFEQENIEIGKRTSLLSLRALSLVHRVTTLQ